MLTIIDCDFKGKANRVITDFSNLYFRDEVQEEIWWGAMKKLP